MKQREYKHVFLQCFDIFILSKYMKLLVVTLQDLPSAAGVMQVSYALAFRFINYLWRFEDNL